MTKINICIQDQTISFESPNQTVESLLKAVDDSVYDAVLITPDGIKHGNPNESILICDGDQFKVASRTDYLVVDYQVNGEEQKTSVNPVTVEKILEIAGRPASIDVNDLKSYYLENLLTEQKYDRLDEEVKLHKGDKFIAVHRGATPVACKY